MSEPSCVSRYLCCCCGHSQTQTHTSAADAARSAWTAKWRDLLNFVRSSSGLTPATQSVRDVVFDSLLRLYAHTDVDTAVHALFTASDTAPHVVRFYVPQLVNFLLYGALPDASKLEVFLLDRCGASLHFAHAVYWYLAAYAPHIAYIPAIASLATRAGAPGANSASSPGITLSSAVQTLGWCAALRTARECAAAATAPPMGVGAGTAPPQDRTALRAVLREYANAVAQAEASRYREHASHTARDAHSHAHARAPRSSTHGLLRSPSEDRHDGGHDGAHDTYFRPSALERAAGVVLASPARLAHVALRRDTARNHDAQHHRPRVHSGDSVHEAVPVRIEESAAQRVSQALQHATSETSSEEPLILAVAPLSEQSSAMPAIFAESAANYVEAAILAPATSVTIIDAAAAHSEPDAQRAFDSTPAVCAELTRISMQLMSAVPENRNAQLRLSLNAVKAQLLPSHTAYIPCGNSHHRLVSIHPEHSFCFKTKSRVPYMVVLEVVDYANTAGGPLEDSDSDDDDDIRERAHYLRSAAVAAAAELGAPFPNKQGRYVAAAPAGRARSGTLGDAQDAAAAAVAAVQAALAEGARQASVVTGIVTERAAALRSYVTSKVNEMRGRPSIPSWHQPDSDVVRRMRGLVSPVRRPSRRASITHLPSTSRLSTPHDMHESEAGFSDFRTPPQSAASAPAHRSVHEPATAGSDSVLLTSHTNGVLHHRRARATSASDMLAHGHGASPGSRSASAAQVHSHWLSPHAYISDAARRSHSAAELAFAALEAADDVEHSTAASVSMEPAQPGRRRSLGLRTLHRTILLSTTPASLRKPLIDDVGSTADRGDGLSQYGAVVSPVRSRGSSSARNASPVPAAKLLPSAALSIPRASSAAMLAEMGQWGSAHGSHGSAASPARLGPRAAEQDALEAGDAAYHPPSILSPSAKSPAAAGDSSMAPFAVAQAVSTESQGLVADADLELELHADDDRLAALAGDLDALADVPPSSVADGAGESAVTALRAASAPIVVVVASATTSATATAATADTASQAVATAPQPVNGLPRTEPQPVSVVFAERWRDKEARVAASSQFAHLPGWRLLPVIVKANDDLRQEQFASQLMFQFAHIFRAARVPVWMRPYSIVATSSSSGLIEAVPDTISIDALKRGDPHFTTLNAWFERHFNVGARGAERVELARMNYVRSLSAYSIVCYILNIKDRHNGNILLDRKGHIIHIDFGFLLTNSPGGNINFEAAPFKLSQEYVQVMGSPHSPLFATFRKLCVRAFLAARKYRARIILLVEMMLSGSRDLPCFRGGPRAVMHGIRSRFFEGATDRQAASYVHDLIDRSLDNWRTRWYDAYQRWAQGVF